MEKEKIYLQNTLAILKQKYNENNLKLENVKKRLNDGVKYLAENRRDIAGGNMNNPENMAGDIASTYSSLGIIESQQEELEKINKKLLLQCNSPYFARIDFTPKKKDKTQKVYIGIANVIDNGKLYVVDWRAPI